MENNIDYWKVVSIVLIMMTLILGGMIIQKYLIKPEPRSMQNFYNLGFSEGLETCKNAYCGDGIIRIKDTPIQLKDFCEI
jgi:hypothetical protein